MFGKRVLTVVALVALFAVATPAKADTWRFDLPPTSDLSILGREVLLLYLGPPLGSVVTKTRIDVTFETDGSFDARDLILQLSPFAPVPPWILHGDDDFGWTEGPGTYTAVLETDMFNGPVVSEFWEGLVDAEGDLWLGGRFLNASAFEVDYIPIPEPASLALLGAGAILICRRGRRG